MSDNIFVPSYFGAPFITTIPETRYDARGRQLSFVESDVQRLERLAFMNASKSRSTSPSPNCSPRSGASSPSRMKLISAPYGDPIELIANRLAEEFNLSSSDDWSSDDEPHILYSTPRPKQSPPSVSSTPTRKSSPSSPATSTFQPGHRRKRSSLSSIPEED
ncbi:hypothetical protein CPB84DRAFT_1962187 [Gymnopilus junonius]|uniref:Uncharacterized protein n=1 Tax=Gymnopilus junonius TaxID=109634 RepID=A0A9P5NQY8_GYMJU|nr:hypothetical protein CPB84DRAFT_1962187 [Gymnopilus junonius]